MSGFVVRLATYHNGGFKEGVSLTVYDELARGEKYAYGCNELVSNPSATGSRADPLRLCSENFSLATSRLPAR
jgi:hypothetical protein